MFEITLNDNLVPCERQAFPLLHPLIDLTQDPIAARDIITRAKRILDTPNTAVYSGFIRKLDQYDGVPGPFGPCVYLQLWESETLVRTFALRGTGYLGIVHIEEGAICLEDTDILGAFCEAMNREDFADKCIGYVDADYTVEIRVPLHYTMTEPLR